MVFFGTRSPSTLRRRSVSARARARCVAAIYKDRYNFNFFKNVKINEFLIVNGLNIIFFSSHV